MNLPAKIAVSIGTPAVLAWPILQNLGHVQWHDLRLVLAGVALVVIPSLIRWRKE